ncbi:uncharacterized protein PRCAT00002713001 [Priceomyces carsonii]|uniref:uncharacterized protein n=1 Tax=Priceomyces carsonii TaxID=28549 RepID=UPI002EDAA99E|nr:unnamed protein product [Priceomyces carsonii]
MKDYTITVLGCGVMGNAVVSAILSASFEPYPSKIICCTNSEKLSQALEKKLKHDIVEFSYGIESNKSAVSKAHIVVLGFKPYMLHTVYEQVKEVLTGEQLIISLLAGTSLEELTIFSPYVAKVMTNTPAQFGCGTAAISFTEKAEEKYRDLVIKLTDPLGLALQIPEKNMDAATSLIGSGPAFYLLMMEAMIDGGIRMGFPYATAKEAAAKVMEGTAKMVLETGEHPAALRSKICTPGGTTIGGLLKMEDAGLRSAIARGVEEAANISASFKKK